MEITTIIPTYNRFKLLSRAINSARNQTYKQIKIVVRDNASTDETAETVMQLCKDDHRIVHQRLSTNIGSHENIRQGIKSVDTEYFSFLCDDDYLSPEFYSEGVKLLDLYPKAAFVAFCVDVVDIDGNFIKSNFNTKEKNNWPLYFNSGDGISAYTQNKLPCTLTGYLFRKEVVNSRP